jgi:hypothetical protein
MAERVLAGDSIVLETQRYRYTRHGNLEDLWFNLSYSPVHDEHYAAGGGRAREIGSRSSFEASAGKKSKKSALYQGTTFSRAINVENTLGFSP